MATFSVLRAVCQNTGALMGVLHRETYLRVLSYQRPALTMVFARQSTSFVGKVTADQLWAGVTSVSNPGRKRGRGRSVRKKTDLNRGQKMGIGQSQMRFPGLTGPALAGRSAVNIFKSSEKPEDTTKQPSRFGKKKVAALERGYTGKKLAGTDCGPPDPINDYKFEGFSSKVLEYKMVAHMTGNLGRKQSISALVITGNGNGLAGYAVAKSARGRAAIKSAKNKAAQRLQFFERYNDHTVFHNFAVKEHKTTIFVEKKPKGYGLVCHRVLKTICQTIGIEDLYAKVEGRTGNIQKLTKAFFRGLMEQETHQKLADRMNLNVVEYRSELGNVPIPVAKPSQGFTREDPLKQEAFDFEHLYYKDGRIPLQKRRSIFRPRHQNLPSYKKYLLLQHRDRNQEHAKYLRIIHGLQPSRKEIKERQRPLK